MKELQMSVHLCVRVYASGEAKESIRDAEGLESWLSYNRQARPGNALFIDGSCATTDLGYLSRVHADGIETILRGEMATRTVGPAARKVAGRYPDDRSRDGFLLRAGVPVASRRRTSILEEGWLVADDIEFMVPGRIPTPAPWS